MNNQSENKEPDFFTPNAPIKYATAGGKRSNIHLLPF